MTKKLVCLLKGHDLKLIATNFKDIDVEATYCKSQGIPTARDLYVCKRCGKLVIRERGEWG